MPLSYAMDAAIKLVDRSTVEGALVKFVPSKATNEISSAREGTKPESRRDAFVFGSDFMVHQDGCYSTSMRVR